MPLLQSQAVVPVFSSNNTPESPPPTPRPTMRRKSSAQNLLSTFSGGGAQGAGLAMQIPPSSISSATGSSLHTVPTPTSIMFGKSEWDAQSMQSDTVASSSATLVSTSGSPALGQGTSLEYLRDIVHKRMVALTYMRNVYDGRSHWFHTILMSRPDLERVFNNVEMKKRTYRFAILGMSLSNLFEITTPQDFLRGLITTLNEYDQFKEETYKPKKRLFRSAKVPKRGAGGMHDYDMPYQDASDTSYLMTPHMPFPLDYHQTLLSLFDILSETYYKLAKMLGSSPFLNSSQQLIMGPLGLSSSLPGVQYLWTGPDGLPGNDMESSLFEIAMGNPSAGQLAGGSLMIGGTLSSPPSAWTPAQGEMMMKIDGKFKKIISTLLKELDAFARNGIKDELASLDPLLRNVALPDAGREQYDFEGAV